MPLIPTTLKDLILVQLGYNTDPPSFPPTLADAALKISLAYKDFFQTATTTAPAPGLVNPLSLEAARSAMQGVLSTILPPPIPDPGFALKFGTASFAFISALALPGSFISTLPQPLGSVTVVQPPTAHIAALAALFLTPMPPVNSQAEIKIANQVRVGLIAAAMYAYAISGHIVTYVQPPPVPPVPAPIL